MKILIPIDFTPVTENALSYALQLPPAKEVVLFHVVNSESEIESASEKLNEMADQYRSGFNGSMFVSVRTGNIFDHIGEEALNQKADIIVMGTHGVKGLQHVLGSRAMKVITNSKTPYIVVQNKPFSQIKNILVPVDFTKESKQVLPFLVALANAFNAKLLLLRQKNSKDEFIRNKIDNNIAYYKSVLEENQCSYELLNAEFTFEKRYKSIVAEATSAGADMIVTAIDPKVDVANYIMGVEEQKIVANEIQLPVLCINIRHFTRFTGSIFDGSA